MAEHDQDLGNVGTVSVPVETGPSWGLLEQAVVEVEPITKLGVGGVVYAVDPPTIHIGQAARQVEAAIAAGAKPLPSTRL